MMAIYLDTHVIVWLYQKAEGLISNRGKTLIEENDLFVSPMVLLELEYLFETRRIKENSRNIYDYLHETIQVQTCPKPFARIASAAIRLKWTHDPFDRIIVAQAAVDESLLLTKDATIGTYYDGAVW